MKHHVQLRRDVSLIPMVNQWYATPYLIPPLTFALTTLYSHLPLLTSFMEDPATHQRCARTPSLRGGPFVDHQGDARDVARFIESTKRDCEEPIALAQAAVRLHELLMERAGGCDLGGIYAEIDPGLEGGYELVYDVCNQAAVRFIEPVLYRRTRLAQFQSCRIGPVTSAERPFILSTPMLEAAPGAVDLHSPFASSLWDLFFTRSGAQCWEEIAAMAAPCLDDAERDLPRLAALFEPATPSQRVRPFTTPESVRMRYFGHACVLLESAGANILIDPLVGYKGTAFVEGFSMDDLPERIDYVLITHPHADHLVLETLLQLRHKIGTVVVGRPGAGGLADISPELLLRHCGFERVAALGEYEQLAFDNGFIVAAPFYGEHGGLDVRSKVTFGVRLQGLHYLFLADSNPPTAQCYRDLNECLGHVDFLFLGMECVGAPVSWAYGPLLRKPLTRLQDQSRRLNGSNSTRAIELVDFFRATYNFVYAMGAEPWVTHISSIVPSPDLPQFVEARHLVSYMTSRRRHVELLYGKREMSSVAIR